LLEMSAVLARISGIRGGDNLLGYSVQQAIYMGTRLLLVLFMPFLGLVVDRGVSVPVYEHVAHSALLFSAGLGFCVYLSRSIVVDYYASVIRKYKRTNNFFLAYFVFFERSSDGGGHERTSFKAVLCDGESRRLFFLSCIVFSVYSVGVFVAFYYALTFSEYRASISQLSGVLNAFGAVLLTFYIEPVISRRIDESANNACLLVMSIFYGRLFSVALAGQAILLIVFGFN